MKTFVQKYSNSSQQNDSKQCAILSERNLLLFVLIAVFAIFASFTVAAAEKLTVVMDSLEMMISIPDQYIVYTQEGLSGNFSPAVSGNSDEEVVSFLIENNIYLNALPEDGAHEIVITCLDDEIIRDTNEISNSLLSTLMSLIVSQVESYGITVTNESIYSSPNRRYMRIMYSTPTDDGVMYGLQYTTHYANKGINITLRSYAGEISKMLEAEMKSIIDSVELAGSQPQVSPNYQTSDSFTYTDSKTKTTFIVPNNWVEEPLAESRETIDVKFSSLEDEGLSILYGSTDTLPLLSQGNILADSRYLVNNRIFTKDVIADLLDIDDSQISVVKFGKNEFYQYSVKTNVDTAGIPLSFNMTYFITVDHGYLYFFQFNGTLSDDHFPDLESMLVSMKFGNP